MELNITAFGIAKDIVGARQLTFEVEDNATIGQLKEKLITAYPPFQALASLSFAVGEEYQADDFQLADQEKVIIIPPVAGG